MVRFFYGLLKVISIRGHGQNPSSIAHHVSIIQFRSCVKNNGIFNSLQSRNYFSFLEIFRITARNKHNCRGTSLVNFKREFVQFFIGHSQKQFHQIRFHSWNHHFRFRIAHSHVVFNYDGFVFHVNQANKHKSFVFDSVFFKTFNGWFNDACFDFFHQNSVNVRNRRNRSHSACIQTCVPFANAFVIFGGWQYFIAFPIGQNETAQFNSVQKFFDDHFRTCCTKFLVHQHISQFILGFRQIVNDQNSFSCCQTISFQDIRRLQSFQKIATFLHRFSCKTIVSRCWNMVFHQKFFGKLFTSFQCGA